MRKKLGRWLLTIEFPWARKKVLVGVYVVRGLKRGSRDLLGYVLAKDCEDAQNKVQKLFVCLNYPLYFELGPRRIKSC